MSDITATPAWSNLEKLHASKADTTLRELFDRDADRAKKLTFDAAGLHVDLSKQLIDADVVDALVSLADTAQLRTKIDAMFAGEHINDTEDRAVLHTALRLPVEANLGWPAVGRPPRRATTGVIRRSSAGVHIHRGILRRLQEARECNVPLV